MTVFFVGAGPGDPELLTVKAKRLIQTSEFCVFAGSLVSSEVLALLPEDARRYDSAGLVLNEIVALYRAAHEKHVDVVRLHTGDPALFGAIAEQMDALDAVGIAYEIVPGVSAFQAAAAGLKVELTVPEVAQAVVLGRAPGKTPVPKRQSLDRFAETRSTLCLYLSVHDITGISDSLMPYLGSDCPAAVVYHASRPDECIVRGTLSTIAEKVRVARITRTAVILIGRALARGGPVSRLYDPNFGHGFRGKRS